MASANNSGVGMENYNRLLQNARNNGDPIGPEHHLYQAARQKWERRQSNLTQLAAARETKVKRGAVNKVKVQIAKAKQKIEEALQAAEEEARIRELAKKKAKEQLGAAYRTGNSTDQIKSVGNGV